MKLCLMSLAFLLLAAPVFCRFTADWPTDYLGFFIFIFILFLLLGFELGARPNLRAPGSCSTNIALHNKLSIP